MGKKTFKDYICRPFCRFFRDGEKEEMACQGALVIERLVKIGRLRPEILPRNGKTPCLWEKYDVALVKHVCRHCPFQAKDCDYQSSQPPPDPEPCGGYILLRVLKKRGIIDINDLEEAAGE